MGTTAPTRSSQITAPLLDGRSMYEENTRKYRSRVFPSEEARSLVVLAQQGDQSARDALVLHNQGIVARFAKGLSSSWPLHFEFMELVQLGNLALLEAIDKFVPTRGTFFGAFAFQHVRFAMLRALREVTGLHKADIKLVQLYYGGQSDEVRGLSWDLIKDRSTLNPEDRITAQDELRHLKKGFVEFLELLNRVGTDWQRQAFGHRYGVSEFLKSGRLAEPKKLEDIGRLFGCTRENVRQAVSACWRKVGVFKEEYTEEWLQVLLIAMPLLEELLYE